MTFGIIPFEFSIRNNHIRLAVLSITYDGGNTYMDTKSLSASTLVWEDETYTEVRLHLTWWWGKKTIHLRNIPHAKK